jgi:hypothetical protein
LSKKELKAMAEEMYRGKERRFGAVGTFVDEDRKKLALPRWQDDLSEEVRAGLLDSSAQVWQEYFIVKKREREKQREYWMAMRSDEESNEESDSTASPLPSFVLRPSFYLPYVSPYGGDDGDDEDDDDDADKAISETDASSPPKDSGASESTGP